MLTSDGSKVIRLVDSDYIGQVLINEGINSFVISVKDSIKEVFLSEQPAMKVMRTISVQTAAACTNGDYVDYLVEALGFPRITSKINVKLPVTGCSLRYLQNLFLFPFENVSAVI
ncbi:hypothetical protein LLY41_02690 [Cytobacillus firmus]|uniref:hypothetical protein n=1 Tax=Cytobacillus firmus TaxID=1399 RepID=UPI00218C4CE6|nr:hypothetical protein [Cytobacillus firmus]URM33409.1 hypothetical protein LLY41_02690 [Cytobacillus firmus]